MDAGRPAPQFLAFDSRLLPGVKKVVTVANPAAGVDWTVAVPGGEQWRVLTATGTLTASAAAGNRVPRLRFTVAGVRIFDTGSATFDTAGLAVEMNWGMGIAQTTNIYAAAADSTPLPQLWLPAGSTVGTFTEALLAGDQWSGVALYVERVYIVDASHQLSEMSKG